MTPLPLTYARRELRGGLKGFRILVACLALGVAAIAAAGSLRAAFDTAMKQDARSLLGGDLDLRQSHRPVEPEQLAALSALGAVTAGIEMRAMATVDDNRARTLVELKGVDGRYPLVGRLELEPAQGPAQALGRRGGVWGAAADANLLARLGLKLGDRVQVGDAAFEVRATIAREPDRIATALAFGPRLLVASEAVAETGLIQPGSLIRYVYRVALAPGTTVAAAKQALARRFPEAGWQLRDTTDAAPGIGRFLDNMASFLTLVGLTALLVGGIGVANAVKAYLDGRIPTIAVLKCVGAPSRLIFTTYFTLVAVLSLAGIAIGLGLGAAVPWAVVAFAGERLPVEARAGVYPLPLALAAGFGVLTALVFTLWPLARARAVPATALFRHLIEPPRLVRQPATLALLAALALALGALAVAGADNRPLAAWFVGASAATLLLFRAVAWALARLAARLTHRHKGGGRPGWRLALAHLHRPGTAVVSVVLSLGLGLTVLVAIALVEGNLARQFGERLPREAPSFYFIDIQPGQEGALVEAARSADPQAGIETAAMVRGRVTRINGTPVSEASVAPEVQWALRGDRGLSTAALQPAGTRVVAGQWWPADWSGEPLVSVDVGVAKGFGLKLGDTLGINVLGREITARVASLRDIDWSSLSMNFTFLLSPNALKGAPHSFIATVRSAPEREAAVEKAITDRLPNVSSIRVKEALESVRGMIANADLAVRLAGAVTLAAGGLVLAGAVMAGHRRRVHEAVVLKVLGATRGQLWRAYLAEFGLVGLATAAAAGTVGTAAAWAILVQVMKADWSFLPGVTAVTLGACVGASLLAGFAGTWTAMRAKAAPLLRDE
jgi:putative ABC transport system permease protein